MAGMLSERDWEVLLHRISGQSCVPFLGAGACYGTLPLGSEIARDWAKAYGYPLTDADDLVRVSQYIAVEYDTTYPKNLILKRFEKIPPPDFREPDEPHAVLADLPLSVYVTTNYDDFMVRALQNRHRDPRRETCRWNDLTREQPSLFDKEPNYRPTPANPIVFHLHGHTDPDSLVLTEDDYLEFLAGMHDPDLLPEPVRSVLARSSMLFIGYRVADWNIRVLLQGLRKRLSKNLSVAVLVPPSGAELERQKVQDYLDRYYSSMDLKIYWGTAREFVAELGRRWREYTANH